MNTGLLMSSTSKATRHAELHKVVTTHTSHTWAALLVKMLLSQINSQTTARGTPYLPKELLKNKYDSARKRLFLFDYDVRTIYSPCLAVSGADYDNARCLGHAHAHRQDAVDGSSRGGCTHRTHEAHL